MEKREQVPLEKVNVVGSGELHVEVDLEQLCSDLGSIAEYEAGQSAVFIRPTDIQGLVMIYRTGKYIVRGGESFENLERVNEFLLHHLRELGVISDDADISLKIRNIVFVGDLEMDIILEQLALELGLENTEFEPEQFPGLIYRPPKFECVLLVFGSGKIVITGSADEDEAERVFGYLKEQVEGN